MENRRVSVRLLEKRTWREGLVSLRIEKPEGFSFEPGRFVRLGLDVTDGQYVARAYSMVSLPEDPFIEFFIVEVKNGLLSPRLCALNAGQSLFIEPELWGSLLPSRLPAGENLWCLTTGTGLAPFLSILRDEHAWLKWHTIVLVHSVRLSEDLAYTGIIEKIATDSSLGGANGHKLIYVPVVTREATQFLSRRIPDLIENGELEDNCGVRLDPESSRVMLCGNPNMILSVRSILKPLGFKAPRRNEPGNLLAENLWND